MKRDYFHVYIVLFRYGKGDNFEPYRSGRDMRVHLKKKDALHECREALERLGRGNAYVAMLGVIS